MRNPLLFLFGYRQLRFLREDAGLFVSLCGQYGFVYRNLSFCEAHVCADCGLGTARKIIALSAARGMAVTASEVRGLPGILWAHRRRVGIPLGMLILCAILFFSGRFVWSIRVEGNESLSDGQVIEELNRCGFSVGTPLEGLNTAILENRVLIFSEKISWISVNLRGTVAHVVIRETASPDGEDPSAIASNLIAERAGEIAWFEEVRGNIAVEVGDKVGVGDLLVGGIYGKEDGPLRYTRAAGRVIARTRYPFEIRIPLKYEKKEYTGEEKTEKYLIFFKKEIKFFGNTGNWSATCDTIDTVEYFGLKEDALLPLGVRTVRSMAYRSVPAARDPASAEELAYERLALLMAQTVPDGALIRKNLRAELTEEEFVLYCDAEYLEDIAKPVKIEIAGAMLPWSGNDTENSNDGKQ